MTTILSGGAVVLADRVLDPGTSSSRAAASSRSARAVRLRALAWST